MPFDANAAHAELAETIYGLDGVTRHEDAYKACTSWEQFFNVDPTNTAIFIDNYDFVTPFVEAEPYILQNIRVAIKYATEIKAMRWPELEVILLDNTLNSSAAYKRLKDAVVYANALIKPGRWTELESLFVEATRPPRAAAYDQQKTLELIFIYLMNIADQPVVDLEDILYPSFDGNLIVDYLQKNNVTGSVSNFENTLLNNLVRFTIQHFKVAVRYAVFVRKTRWESLELIMNNNPSAPDIMFYKTSLMTPADLYN